MRYAVALLQLLQQIVLLQLCSYTLRKDLAADEVCSRLSLALLQLLQQRYAAGYCRHCRCCSRGMQ